MGYADQLRGSAGELPDAQNRLSYIARLTGEAAEKVLSRVEQAKAQQDRMAAENRRVLEALVRDPVAAVAKGLVYNHLVDMEREAQVADNHLTEIMMAQDFHDLTGQVIARVVNLAGTIEKQLVQLLVQTAPPSAQSAPLPTPERKQLSGPVVDPDNTPDVVTNQSEVDDLLASLALARGADIPQGRIAAQGGRYSAFSFGRGSRQSHDTSVSSAMSSSQDKNLPATARKLQAVMMGKQRVRATSPPGCAGCWCRVGAGAGRPLVEALQFALAQQLHFNAEAVMAHQSMFTRMRDMVVVGAVASLVFALFTSVAVVASSIASGGWIYSFKPITPDSIGSTPLSGAASLFPSSS